MCYRSDLIQAAISYVSIYVYSFNDSICFIQKQAQLFDNKFHGYIEKTRN